MKEYPNQRNAVAFYKELEKIKEKYKSVIEVVLEEVPGTQPLEKYILLKYNEHNAYFYRKKPCPYPSYIMDESENAFKRTFGLL